MVVHKTFENNEEKVDLYYLDSNNSVNLCYLDNEILPFYDERIKYREKIGMVGFKGNKFRTKMML